MDENEVTKQTITFTVEDSYRTVFYVAWGPVKLDSDIHAEVTVESNDGRTFVTSADYNDLSMVTTRSDTTGLAWVLDSFNPGMGFRLYEDPYDVGTDALGLPRILKVRALGPVWKHEVNGKAQYRCFSFEVIDELPSVLVFGREGSPLRELLWVLPRVTEDDADVLKTIDAFNRRIGTEDYLNRNMHDMLDDIARDGKFRMYRLFTLEAARLLHESLLGTDRDAVLKAAYRVAIAHIHAMGRNELTQQEAELTYAWEVMRGEEEEEE